MKRLLLVSVMLYAQLSMAQFKINQYDKEYFLLGTLDDYMGHQQTFTMSGDSFFYEMVDIYHQGEMKKALWIDSLFKGEYPDLYMKNNGASKGIKLYSATLTKKIDRYYQYKPSGNLTIFRDTIYTGHLKEDFLKTDQQKLSFLAGVFYRVDIKPGEKECFINIANSVSKAKIFAKLLEEFGCAHVTYKVMSDYIPVGHWVTFEPSERIRKIIMDVQTLNQ